MESTFRFGRALKQVWTRAKIQGWRFYFLDPSKDTLGNTLAYAAFVLGYSGTRLLAVENSLGWIAYLMSNVFWIIVSIRNWSPQILWQSVLFFEASLGGLQLSGFTV